MTATTTITWTAHNNSTYLDGERASTTLYAAARAARDYVRNELYGEGRITYFVDGAPVRVDECNTFTGYRWRTYSPY